MRFKLLIVLLAGFALTGCGKKAPPENIVVAINDYKVTLSEFEQGFAQSPFASGTDKAKARKEYLENLINHKVIVQDAQKRNIDKNPEFLKSIERFWEQSLLTEALGTKTKEISGTVHVTEQQIQHTYEQMVKEGLTTESYEDMYPQIKWQAAKQIEAQLLGSWIESLRTEAKIDINDSLLQAQK